MQGLEGLDLHHLIGLACDQALTAIADGLGDEDRALPYKLPA